MHVVFRESHGLEDADTPYDLGQSPADLVVLSFSDSDLGAFMAGYKRAGGALPSLRLANLIALKHPLSVDEYVEKTLVGAKGILVRLIGGEAYWAYGLGRLEELAREKGIALAVLPADGSEDARLDAISNLPKSTLDRLKYLCDAGGAVAAQAALAQLALAAGLYAPPVIGKKDVPDFGFYDPQSGVVADFEAGRAFVLVVFYRSYVTSADLSPVDMIIEALRDRGYDAVGMFVPSLKNAEAREWVERALERLEPKAILNATAFSAQSDALEGSPLDVADVPVFQLGFSTARRSEWLASDRGLSPQDLAMHVVLPEVDGRIFAGVASFKAVAPRDEELQYARFQHWGDAERIANILDLVEGWIGLGVREAEDTRLAIVLSTYPGKAYQMAHAVGCDALASSDRILRALQSEGYDVLVPDDLAGALRSRRLRLSLEDYQSALAGLPDQLVQDLNAAWGAVEDDHSFEDGAFAFSAFEAGKAVVALQPERGFAVDRAEAYHDLERVPCHGYVAFYLMLQDRVDALVHVGAHGTLEWLPGNSVALSQDCWPEALIGALPVIYPFIVNDPGEAAMAKRRIHAVTLGHLPPPLGEAETPQTLIELEQRLDEYSSADGLDPKRRDRLVEDIRDLAQSAGVENSLGLDEGVAALEAVAEIDRFVCDVKESQFAKGLHIYGEGACGGAEMAGLFKALGGARVEAGPSGSPYRGRKDVLPTGRNLFAVDPSALPTRSSYAQGVKLAEELIRRHLQDHGDYPRQYFVDLWGSATMRTGGEEFAMALHLAGIAPKWNEESGRVTGFDILPLALLDRPRIGVVLRVSGLFRDVFPGLIGLFEQAVAVLCERVLQQDENADMNPYGDGMARVFAPRPQSYGIAMDDTPAQYDENARQLAGEAWLKASEWVIDKAGEMRQDREAIKARVRDADGFVHVQDLVETDVLMASDFATHQAGFNAARAALGAEKIANYHMDHSQAGAPKARALSEEIARVVYARASRPDWINSMKAHGFRGGAEMAATLDHMAQFAHLAQAVAPELFDRYYEASLGREDVREFLSEHNPEALAAMNARFRQLLDAGLWQTRKNSIRNALMEAS